MEDAETAEKREPESKFSGEERVKWDSCTCNTRFDRRLGPMAAGSNPAARKKSSEIGDLRGFFLQKRSINLRGIFIALSRS